MGKSKGLGFSRTVMLDWLDVIASLCVQNVESAKIRQQLSGTISGTVHGMDAQRKTIDVLMAIWVKSQKSVPGLHRLALSIFPTLTTTKERLWLHYGMALSYYQIFRKCTVAIGQIGRTEGTITRKVIKDRIAADYGHLGALDRSVERIIASLTNWGVLLVTTERSIYKIQLQTYRAQDKVLETWLLACALEAHPSESIPFNDLVHLPELFPFTLSVNLDYLRKNPLFVVHRQGGDLDMIQLKQ